MKYSLPNGYKKLNFGICFRQLLVAVAFFTTGVSANASIVSVTADFSKLTIDGAYPLVVNNKPVTVDANYSTNLSGNSVTFGNGQPNTIMNEFSLVLSH